MGQEKANIRKKEMVTPSSGYKSNMHIGRSNPKGISQTDTGDSKKYKLANDETKILVWGSAPNLVWGSAPNIVWGSSQ